MRLSITKMLSEGIFGSSMLKILPSISDCSFVLITVSIQRFVCVYRYTITLMFCCRGLVYPSFLPSRSCRICRETSFIIFVSDSPSHENRDTELMLIVTLGGAGLPVRFVEFEVVSSSDM